MNHIIFKSIFAATLLFNQAALAVNVKDDQTVPVPGPVREQASGITVNGTPGAGQEKKKIHIAPMELDAKGGVVRAGEGHEKLYNLGQEAVLGAGLYVVTYARSMSIVELHDGDHKVINLQKINVPQVDGNYKVELFADLTDASEMDKRLQEYWSTGYWYNHGDGTDDRDSDIVEIGFPEPPRDQAWTICAKLDPGTRWTGLGKNSCKAWLGRSYKALLGPSVKTDQEASFIVLEFSYYYRDTVTPQSKQTQFKNYGRRIISKGKDGDFFSVLPGVYGLEFTNLTGQTFKTMGIVAK
jgi:hypothetical protein